MNKLAERIIPFLLWAVAFILRAFLVGKGAYMGDTLYLVMQSSKILSEQQMYYLHYPGYPLVALLGALAIQIGTWMAGIDPALSVNYATVFLSSLCVLFNYVIIRKLFDALTAFYSSLLLTVHPLFLALSVVGNSHIPAIFFLLGGIVLLLKFSETRQMRFAFFCGVMLGLGAACRIQDIIAVSPALLFLLFSRCRKVTGQPPQPGQIVRPLIGIIGSASLTLLIFYAPMILNYLNDPDSLVLQSGSNLLFTDKFVGLAGLISYPMVYTLQHFHQSYLTLGVFLIAAGLVLLMRHHRQLAVFLLLWILVPAFLFGIMRILVPRYLAIILIPLNILIAYTCTVMHHQSLFLKRLAVVIILFLYGTYFFNIYPILYARHLRAPLTEFSFWVGRQTEANALIIGGDEKLFIEHYGQRQIFPRPYFMHSYNPEHMQDFVDRLKETLDQGVPVYSTGIGIYSYDYNRKFSEMMHRNFRITLVGKHLSEDWHSGMLGYKVGYESLFRISNK